jgi:hypothetical protein
LGKAASGQKKRRGFAEQQRNKSEWLVERLVAERSAGAFSSEVGTGSLSKKTRQNKKLEPPFRFNGGSAGDRKQQKRPDNMSGPLRFQRKIRLVQRHSTLVIS